VPVIQSVPVSARMLIRSGLIGWFEPGTDGPTTAKNWALGGNNATIVGTPTYGSGYATFTANLNFLQTDLLETNDMTFFIVARSAATFVDTAHRPALLGYQANGSLLGAEIVVTATTGAPQCTLTEFAAYNTGSVVQENTARSVANFSAFKYLWGRIDSVGQALYLLNRTDGSTETSTTTTGTRVLSAPAKLRIGSTFNTTFGGAVDVAHCSIYNNAVPTSPGIVAHYNFVQADLLARFGITI
jgi:hypothetical protein